MPRRRFSQKILLKKVISLSCVKEKQGKKNICFIENKKFYKFKIKIHESKVAEAIKLCRKNQRRSIDGFNLCKKTVKTKLTICDFEIV